LNFRLLDKRLNQLQNWLKTIFPNDDINLTSASADASFRRYFRIETKDQVIIAMDAPPDKEDCGPFLHRAKLLQDRQVHVPEIYAQDLEQGFILLEDLGQIDYLTSLRSGGEADILYSDAMIALTKIQSGDPELAPKYDQSKLVEEMARFKDWFIERHLGESLDSASQEVWSALQERLCLACTEQPQVWVHRDFHSRNLMVTGNNPGIIDFQDLVTGPISYDLASIFKDCYIEWPREQQLVWLGQYYEKLDTPSFSLDQLVEWYDLTGFQRHLKVLGIFCRLNYRDGKQNYLKDLPLVGKYCLEVMELYSSKIVEIRDFNRLFSTFIQKATIQN